jgi:protein-S-isoprenylcysteine O-methyltransferase Ste14
VIKISSLAAKYRTFMTRVMAVLLVLLVLGSTHSFAGDSVWDIFFEATGIFLLGVCCLGRLWALMYISGNKIHTLITDGPYSIVRHPLYVFSLMGALGIGLLSENVAVLAVLSGFFLLYYPFVIAAEERILLMKHGHAYENYMARVPRYVPRWSLLREPLLISVHAAIYRKTFSEAIWFIWAIIPLEIIERLHEASVLPVFLRFP